MSISEYENYDFHFFGFFGLICFSVGSRYNLAMESQQKTATILKELYIDFCRKGINVRCLTGAPVREPDKDDPNYDSIDYPPYNTTLHEENCIYDGLNKNEVFEKCNFHDKIIFENALFELLSDYKFIEYSDEDLEFSQSDISEYGISSSDVVGHGPKKFIRLTYVGYKEAKNKDLSGMDDDYSQTQAPSMPKEVSFYKGIITFGDIRYQPSEDLALIFEKLWGHCGGTIKIALFNRSVNRGYPTDSLGKDIGCKEEQAASKCNSLRRGLRAKKIPITVSITKGKARLILKT